MSEKWSTIVEYRRPRTDMRILQIAIALAGAFHQ